MSIYQAIVLGLGFLVLFGAGYLITTTDNAGILKTTITQTTDTADIATSTLVARLEGYYLCDSESGCSSPSSLTITQDGEVRMTTSYSEGVEILEETGTWKDEKGSGLKIFLTGTDSGLYPVPKSFFVKYVSSSSLSGIDFDSATYKDWIRPVFIKQEKNEL